MITNCVRKLKTGIHCADVVEMWDGLWRGEEKVNRENFMNTE